MVFGKMNVIHGIAVPFICALLSHTGQYNMQNKTQQAIKVNKKATCIKVKINKHARWMQL